MGDFHAVVSVFEGAFLKFHTSIILDKSIQRQENLTGCYAMLCEPGLRRRNSRRRAGQRIVGLVSGLLGLRSLYLGSGLQPRRAMRRRFVLAW